MWHYVYKIVGGIDGLNEASADGWELVEADWRRVRFLLRRAHSPQSKT